MNYFKKSTYALLFLALPLLLAGCKKDTKPVGYSNPNPAKDTPMYETALSEFTGLYRLSPNSDGTFYALASRNYASSVLKIDGSGTVLGTKDLGFSAGRCMVKTGESIMMVGSKGYHSSPYTMADMGMVAVVDPSLDFVGMTVTETQYKIELTTLVQDSDNPTLFYAGGWAIDNDYIQYPYICTIEYRDGLLSKIHGKVFHGSNNAKCRIIGMVEKKVSDQKDFIVEMLHYSNADDPEDEGSCTVHIAKLNYFDEEWGWGHSTWDVAIEGPLGVSYASNNSIDSDDENIYFFGSCYDEKTPKPLDGYWNSGCVATVNWREGREVWTKVVSITSKDEIFLQGQLINGCLYACGGHSGVHYPSTKMYFYNGLVAKFDLSGALLDYKTFGASDCSSRVSHFVKDLNGNLVCVGWTGENTESGRLLYMGWFLKTDFFTNSAKPDASKRDENQDEALNQCCSHGLHSLAND